MNITDFTFKELVKTDTGLDNMPNDMNVIKNLVKLAQFLQTIRNELHLPIVVTSGYRSKEVNEAVGGRMSFTTSIISYIFSAGSPTASPPMA